MHAANGGYAREHACAIGVSQAALDVIMLELAGIDGICALHIFAQLGYVLVEYVLSILQVNRLPGQESIATSIHDLQGDCNTVVCKIANKSWNAKFMWIFRMKHEGFLQVKG